MKFTFEELKNKKSWLVKEIMSSLSSECYTDQVMEEQYFDIQLSVNGRLVEPQLFNHIMEKIEKVIDFEAKALLDLELEQARAKINKLSLMLEDISSNISEEYSLNMNDYE